MVFLLLLLQNQTNEISSCKRLFQLSMILVPYKSTNQLIFENILQLIEKTHQNQNHGYFETQ
ncbi:MAG: hypothetical protein EA361_12010 [Bacteroidetes bacterium]|nr:MAG: hypothetical protein EA361_12010 [Bacteroidota bacterium]